MSRDGNITDALKSLMEKFALEQVALLVLEVEEADHHWHCSLDKDKRMRTKYKRDADGYSWRSWNAVPL
jgi:hypothetical protein